MAYLQKRCNRITDYGALVTFIILAINLQCCLVKAASISRWNGRVDDSCEDICVTSTCTLEAVRFLNMMDESVNPCDDFYQFVCGDFIKKKMIIDQVAVVNSFTLAQSELSNEIFHEILSPISPNDLKTFKNIKTYYKNCMNQSRVDREGVRPLFKILEKIGGWPLLLGDSWNETSYDWRETIYKINDLDIFVFFPVISTIDIDYKNSSKYMIKIQDCITTISPLFLLNDPSNNLLREYYNFIVNISVSLGADKEIAHREMKKVLDFEIELFNTKTLPEELLNVTESDNQITIKELSEKHPSIPWLKLLNKVFNPSGIFVNETESVFITDPAHLAKLEVLLKETPKRVLANYIAWYVTHITLMYMPDHLREAVLNFNSVVEGTKKAMSRESWCLNEIMEAFPIGVSAMYVRSHFNSLIRDSVAELVSNIKKQSRRLIEEVDWMDEKTRAAALEKLEIMGIAIGYADELMDDQKIEEYYAGLDISRGNYLKSAFNVSSFLVKQNYKVLRKPVDKNLWTLSHNAAVINAYYILQKNIIEIPAGFLRSFFRTERPNYLNYGAIGSIIGHEITHGFDNQGRKHDKEGNQKNWWEPSTEQQFLRKARCIIDQYNNFTVAEVGLKVNGARTQGENIADNAGFKVAYRAYLEWSKGLNESEACLPGLDYTPRQLFWISAASNWCSKERPEYLRDIVSSDSHSPESARVDLSFSNIAEFARDFNCPLGSRMNPVHKCVVW